MVIRSAAFKSARLDGHEIGDLGDTVVAEEARDQDVGFRKVELFTARLADQADLEEPALGVIEESGKNARRVKPRQTAPIDGTIHADQGNRMQVTDDAVVFNRFVSQFCL